MAPQSPLKDEKMVLINVPPKSRLRRKRRPRGPDEPPREPGKRSSSYRGVTKHRWTGRYEAHLWDKNCYNIAQNKKGKQVYLGAYDDEVAAARTYDLAALKYWGTDTSLNFPFENYAKEYEEMQRVTREEYMASLRRKSSGFSRGASKYRGVAKHHHNGRWEARIGRVFGNKYLYLGTYDTQEEAATAYDLAAIEYRGVNAVTNFNINQYTRLLPQPQRPFYVRTQPNTYFQNNIPPQQVPEIQPPEPLPALPVSVPTFEIYSNEVSDTIDTYSNISDTVEDVSWSTMYADSAGFDTYSDIHIATTFDDVDIAGIFAESS